MAESAESGGSRCSICGTRWFTYHTCGGTSTYPPMPIHACDHSACQQTIAEQAKQLERMSCGHARFNLTKGNLCRTDEGDCTICLLHGELAAKDEEIGRLRAERGLDVSGDDPNDYERTYAEVWRGIVENADGSLNLDQVKRELHDFSVVLHEVPKVYSEVTGGRVSKPNTRADAAIGEHSAYVQTLIEDALEEDRGLRAELEGRKA